METDPKPIDVVLTDLKKITSDIKEIRGDLLYIKEKIKQKVIQEKIRDAEIFDDAVIQKTGCWFASSN